MTADKIIAVIIDIAFVFTAALVLLICTPWAAAPPSSAAYTMIVIAFWLLLLVRLWFAQWCKRRDLTYKSYIGHNNGVKKKLLDPRRKALARAARGLLKPRYVVVLVILALLFGLNHLLLFYPDKTAASWQQFWGAGSPGRSDLLLLAAVVSVLALAGAVLAQTRELKKNNRIFHVQNLIIQAHSRVDLDKLYLRFVDSEKMFLAANKTEYILQAKPLPAIKLPHGQALLQTELSLKLMSEIPVTEFYVKRLSLLVADVVIECENYRQNFYPLFAVNNVFTLNFYIQCKEVSSLKLSEKFGESAFIRLYYSFVLKNSVGVNTELYGAALYEKEQASGALLYLPREARDNQYFYI